MLALEGERKIEVLANSRFNERSPVFSPMGAGSPTSQMNREDMRSMFRPFRGRGGRRQISTKGGESPRWSRDGRRLFYRIDEGLDVRGRSDGGK